VPSGLIDPCGSAQHCGAVLAVTTRWIAAHTTDFGRSWGTWQGNAKPANIRFDG